ncbi:hypothetical protein FRC18_006900, partial [Serendipita sp. 400]
MQIKFKFRKLTDVDVLRYDTVDVTRERERERERRRKDLGQSWMRASQQLQGQRKTRDY